MSTRQVRVAILNVGDVADDEDRLTDVLKLVHDSLSAGPFQEIDYRRMMRIVLDAGYRGWVGIEYEGGTLPEAEGIDLTRQLLERVREELEPEYA